MFTGIIQEIGVLKKRLRGQNSYKLVIKADEVLQEIKKGDSIAVNGVCLTVVDFTRSSFTADIMPETLRMSNISQIKIGDSVNLEQAVRPEGFFGGHLVTGHIDGTGEVKSIKNDKNAQLIEIKITPYIEKYLVDKGSVAINGVSLTIVRVEEESAIVSLIPETREKTNLKFISTGDVLNIETDLIGKYVVKMMQKMFNSSKSNKANSSYYQKLDNDKSDIDMDFLRQNGFLN